MRSLGMSPTITELKKYFSENSKLNIQIDSSFKNNIILSICESEFRVKPKIIKY